MRPRIFLLIFLFVVFFFSCGNKPVSQDNKGKKVLIKTSFGDMVVKLYDETPLHRDNFLKLAKEGFYDELLFHRVIKEFMIQTGDPESRGAKPQKRLGVGGPGYDIPAEINPTFYHKKGALAAARTGDEANPERKSSGSQFYIVQGKVFTDEGLTQLEESQKNRVLSTELNKLLRKRQAEINKLYREGLRDSADAMMASVRIEAEQNVNLDQYTITAEKKAVYTSMGGTPFLDGAYTVFGEVIEGFHVIDSIANVKTQPGDRPLEDVKMWVEIIE